MEIEEEEEFERYSEKARSFLSRVICSEPDFEDDDVRSCICALSDIYFENGTVTAVAGYDSFEQEAADDEILMHTVELYLPSALLYCGF